MKALWGYARDCTTGRPFTDLGGSETSLVLKLYQCVQKKAGSGGTLRFRLNRLTSTSQLRPAPDLLSERGDPTPTWRGASPRPESSRESGRDTHRFEGMTSSRFPPEARRPCGGRRYRVRWRPRPAPRGGASQQRRT